MSEDTKKTTKKAEEAAKTVCDEVAAASVKVAEETVVTAEKPDTFVYVGPNLPKGLLKKGSVFNGTRTEVMKHLENVTAAYPEISALLVTSDKLPDAKVKLQTGGNLLASNFARLVERTKNK